MTSNKEIVCLVALDGMKHQMQNIIKKTQITFEYDAPNIYFPLHTHTTIDQSRFK